MPISHMNLRCNCENAHCEHCKGNGCSSRAHPFLRIDWIGEVCSHCYYGDGMSQYYLPTPSVRATVYDVLGNIIDMVETVGTLRGIACLRTFTRDRDYNEPVTIAWEGSLTGVCEDSRDKRAAERYFAAWFDAQNHSEAAQAHDNHRKASLDY